MQHIIKTEKRKRSNGQSYLTLAVAMSAIVLVGGLMLTNLLRPSGNNFAGIVLDNPEQQATATFTPTPIPVTVDPFATPTLIVENLSNTREDQTTTPIMATVPPFDATIVPADMGSFSATATPIAMEIIPDNHIPIIVAAQDISRGTIITEEMVYRTTYPVDIVSHLMHRHGAYIGFFQNVSDVVGALASSSIRAYQPLDADAVTIASNTCPNILTCPELEDGFYSISLPYKVVAVGDLLAGDRVDMFGIVDGQLVTLVEDILYLGHDDRVVNLAAVSWKQSVLTWAYHAEIPYLLRPIDPANQAQPITDSMTDYSFTVESDMPVDMTFQVLAELPDSESYRLAELPYSIDRTPFTAGGTTFTFWYTRLDIVSMEAVDDNTRRVTLNLRTSDAENLEFLRTNGAEISILQGVGGDGGMTQDNRTAIVLPLDKLQTPRELLERTQQVTLVIQLASGEEYSFPVEINHIGAYSITYYENDQPTSSVTGEGARLLLSWEDEATITTLTEQNPDYTYRLDQ